MEKTIDPIGLHSAQAKYYKYRTPYIPALFERLSQSLVLNSDSCLLDICCGSGEVATGMANYAGKIFAIDGSEEMLSFAAPSEKISYSICDVNNNEFIADRPVDHFVIGRAIHWITPSSLGRLVSNNLKDGGKIVICSTQWGSMDPWYKVYQSLIGDYKISSEGVDFSGKGTLKDIGFDAIDRISVASSMKVNLNYLLGYTLAVTYGPLLDKLVSEQARFESELARNIGPHLRDGVLDAMVKSWAIVYQKTAD